ncbi:RNA polymerase sigma factor [Alicyclobacillus sp. SO9]|uniref:RNA polymerase sigma factor n=1 Tax=Alicyclobacillus sp. SO9 TaxID=2665646 RepID=UPI0018E8CD82|nr:sigma-70 family RNA polymerase sigma factor [Alicyclobacillus sp. SO9]QQE78917.1 sigma-70 family RNA polymerase sigma factor [Alicyclobacillus sp. SO9]
MQSDADKRDAIKDMYDLYRHDLYRFARYTLGNSEDAYDVVQEVFIRAIRSWNGFRQDSSPKTWLLSIARNYMYDVLRKKQRKENFLRQNTLEVMDDKLSYLETRLVLEEAMTKLKAAHRQVFVLRHIEKVSIQETARVLKWSSGKVKMTDHRAVLKLKEIMTNMRGR